MPKKKTPEEQIVDLVGSIRGEFARWKHIKKHGAGDPGWPDGTNMNLVRNHIIYDQMKLKELCERNCPKEARLKPPREVSNEFMAKKRKKAK